MKSLFMGDVARSITREPRDGETQRAETRLSFYSPDVKRPGINNRRIRGKKSRKVRPRRALFSPLSFIVSPFSTSVCFRGSRVHVEENVDTIVRSKQLSLERELQRNEPPSASSDSVSLDLPGPLGFLRFEQFIV